MNSVLGKQLKKYIPLVSSTLSAPVAIYNLVKIWEGNRNTLIIVSAVLTLAVFAASTCFIAFSRKRSSTLPVRSVLRYGRYAIAARWVLGILGLIPIGFAFWLHHMARIEENKTIILVTSFESEGSARLGLTDGLVYDLREAVSKRADCFVKYIGSSVSQAGGTNEARELGEDYRADFVVWGRTTTRGANCKVTLHVENMVVLQQVPLEKTFTYELQFTEEELAKSNLHGELLAEVQTIAFLITGLARFEKEDYRGSMEEFTMAIEASKNAKEIMNRHLPFFYRGTAYFNVGEMEASIRDLKEAAKLNPEDVFVLVNLGAALGQAGKFQAAVDCLGRGLLLRPHASLYANRANAYFQMGQYPEVVSDLTQYMTMVGNGSPPSGVREVEGNVKQLLAEAHNRIGQRNLDSRKFQQAILAFGQAIRVDSSHKHAWHNLALAEIESGDSVAGMNDLNRAIAIDSTFAEAYNSRGTLHVAQRDTSAAIRDFTRAIKVKSDYWTAYSNRAMVHFAQGDYCGSWPDFDTLLLVDTRSMISQRGIPIPKPKVSTSRFFVDRISLSLGKTTDIKSRDQLLMARAVMLLGAGRLHETINDLNAISVSAPPALLASAYLHRGIAYMLDDSLADAIQHFGLCLRISPANSDALRFRAYCYERRGSTAMAVSELRTLYQSQQRDVSLQEQLVHTLLRRAEAALRDSVEYMEIEKDITDALEIQPNKVEALALRGSLRSNRGEYDLAVQDLSKAYQQTPGDSVVQYNLGGTFYNWGMDLFQMNNIEGAVAKFSKAIEYRHKLSESFNYLGVCFNKLEKYDEAIRFLDSAILVNDSHVFSHQNRGSAYFNKGEYASAWLDFSDAIRLLPSYAEAYFGRAMASYQMGKREDAIMDLRRSRTLSKDPQLKAMASDYLHRFLQTKPGPLALKLK